jgi:polyisoprenyl-phosphate glycosyltransferase
LAGVLLLFLGIIGEYVGRMYEESKGRPLYILDRVVGGPPGSEEDSIKRAKEAGDLSRDWRRR